MDKNFTKFNKNILEQITNFINSPDDLLYIGGFQGCGKSEIIDLALEGINLEDTLLFKHLCFENSVIDDFLLGFYDTFRSYSINKKIVLKKSLTENFARKVDFYFKDIDKNSLIIIDNFEIITKNSEIIDFLAHLGKYENVKIILISRIINSEYFENKGLKCQVIEIKANDYSTFKLKVEEILETYEESDIQTLFEETKGYELYLQMTLRYLATVNASLKEFMDEFKKRNTEFENFLLSKIISLVPAIYLPFLQNMAALSHAVKINFIENYRLGDISQVNYLHRKFLISKFADEIYLKDYLKKRFLDSLTIQEKANNYKNLIKIYEEELTKSPKDRLLRLSRESIRKQIEFLKTKIPQQKRFEQTNFSYISQAGNAKPPWYSELPNLNKNKILQNPTLNLQKKSVGLIKQEYLNEEEEKLLKEYRENKLKNKNIVENKISELLKEAKHFEENYDYNSAIKCLMEAEKINHDKNYAGKIMLKLAKNNVKINSFETAIKYFNMATQIFSEIDKNSYFNTKLELAGLFRRLYRLEKAKATFVEIVNQDENNDKNTIAKGFLGLGEIYEMEHNFKAALENYENALIKSDKDNPDSELLSEIYFKIASIYDDGQNAEKALEYYQKSIINARKCPKENKYFSLCYANSGMIYSENGSYDKAVENFERALEIDTKNENINGIYFSSRQLASIYRDFEPEKALKYLLLALDNSKKLDDTFKIAISHIEIGDYYYNKRENSNALINYLEAKKTLGDGISDENKDRILIRIKDMKIKMDKNEFEEIMKNYE